MNTFTLLLWLGGTGAALFLLAWAATVGDRLSAAWRHAVWLLALVVPLIVLPLAAANLHVEWAILPPAPASPPKMDIEVETPVPALAAIDPVSQFPLQQRVVSSSPNVVIDWLFVVWVAGTAITCGLLVVAHGCQIWRLSRLSGTDVPAVADRLLRELGSSLPTLFSPRILIGRGATVPFCYGLVRSWIVLPDRAKDWNAETTRACLAHELAHLHRHDLLWLTLGQAACAICWFNPLAWAALGQLRRASESAADDLAMGGSAGAGDYAERLLQVASFAGPGTISPVAFPMARRAGLHRRIASIVDEKRSRRVPGLAGISAIALAVTFAIVAGFGVRLVEAGVTPQNQKSAKTNPDGTTDKPVKRGHFGDIPVEITSDGHTEFKAEGKVAVATDNAILKFNGIEAKADRMEYSPESRTAQLFRKAGDKFELAGTLILDDTPEGPYEFARKYIEAVNRKDAKALREFFYSEPLKNWPEADRNRALDAWVESAMRNQIDPNSDIRITRWDLAKIEVKPPYYLPAKPSFRLDIQSKTGTSVTDAVIQLQDGLRLVIPIEGDSLTKAGASEDGKMKVYITGAVAKPGQYVVDEGISLLAAMAVAGGATDYAELQKVRISRTGQKDRLIADKGTFKDVVLSHGDIVVVPRSFW